MKKKLEEKLEKWAYLAKTYPDKVFDETEEVEGRPRNIWMINHFAIPPDMPGGSRHYDFGVELVKKGYKVTIFTTDFSYATLQRILDLKILWKTIFVLLKRDELYGKDGISRAKS